jgi:hypothetical protein
MALSALPKATARQVGPPLEYRDVTVVAQALPPPLKRRLESRGARPYVTASSDSSVRSSSGR